LGLSSPNTYNSQFIMVSGVPGSGSHTWSPGFGVSHLAIKKIKCVSALV